MNEVTRQHPFRAHVMVPTSFVVDQFRPIILYMEALISNADTNAYRDFSGEAMMARLFEAADHHLSFELGRKQGNVGFDYYIQEYCGQFARFLTCNAEFMQMASIHFANVVGYLVRMLDYARTKAEEVGAVVTEVESTPYQGWDLFSYMVVAGFDNHLYDHVQSSMAY
jgi:hypothetical protein